MGYVIGIDPGWASCGYSLTLDDKVVTSGNFIPRDHVAEGEVLSGGIDYLTNAIEHEAMCQDEGYRIAATNKMYIERYVAYKGIHSDTSEAILMFIGALIHRFEFDGVGVFPVRAIDWKPKVCKYLVRTKGFNNPYPSFDKKYSILAAKTLSGLDLKSDHAADAVCLSYLGEIDKYNLENKK